MIDEKLKQYLHNLIPNRSPFFEKMEQYAKIHKVPIMDPYSMETCLQMLRVYKPQNILEIGAAIGYSALRMASATDAKIVTIERDSTRIEEAKGFINESGMSDRITLLEGDALELVEEASKYGPYDFIFIDAAKGQYMKFFEEYEKLTKESSLIITDNVLFKGYVYEEDPENKRLSSLGKKINRYNEWLVNNPSYHTVILPVGDGIAISIKK